jgi:RNA-directed DNA polymerase
METSQRSTQKNRGKLTAGLDGQVYLTAESRIALLSEINTKHLFSKAYKPTHVKRIYIPKPDGSKRPLGIPTVIDRIYQELVRMALDPEWEGKFHAHSYGFRSGRNCQDAIEMIKKAHKKGYKYILEADLSKCFDHLNHQYILRRISKPYRQIIKKWLKIGIIDMGTLLKTDSGTPQGGVISPLLSNIALNTLDHAINHVRGLILIRFADDFIVNKAKCGIESLIKKIGPSFNEKKTKIVTIQQGFSFLGFHFIQYPNKTLWVQPQRERVKVFLVKLKTLISTHKQVPTKYLIVGLNSRTRGWTNYYRFCRTHTVYSHIQNLLWRWIWNWCKRRHPKKSKHWVYKHYYVKGDRRWQLVANDFKLRDLFDTKRKSYRWNVGSLSPYDPRKGVQELWKKKKLGKYYA